MTCSAISASISWSGFHLVDRVVGDFKIEQLMVSFGYCVLWFKIPRAVVLARGWAIPTSQSGPLFGNNLLGSPAATYPNQMGLRLTLLTDRPARLRCLVSQVSHCPLFHFIFSSPSNFLFDALAHAAYRLPHGIGDLVSDALRE
jgi:hypothetical protein